MKVHLDCFPCFLRQAVIAARLATDDAHAHLNVIKAVLPVIESADVSKPPSYSTTFLHRKIRETLGKDPFDKIKHKYNQIALSLYPRLKDIVKSSENMFSTATRLAIAGNVIDFGIYTSINIDDTISRALSEPLAIDVLEDFCHCISNAKKILYLLDNAGEIVFDKLLIETLIARGHDVTAVVKGSAVLNDATMHDAMEVGLDKLCKVINNGSDCIGTILELVSRDFLKDFNKADMIISKGQGNLESLYFEATLNGKEIYYLLQAKCDVVAQELNVKKGAMLFCKHMSHK